MKLERCPNPGWKEGERQEGEPHNSSSGAVPAGPVARSEGRPGIPRGSERVRLYGFTPQRSSVPIPGLRRNGPEYGDPGQELIRLRGKPLHEPPGALVREDPPGGAPSQFVEPGAVRQVPIRAPVGPNRARGEATRRSVGTTFVGEAPSAYSAADTRSAEGRSLGGSVEGLPTMISESAKSPKGSLLGPQRTQTAVHLAEWRAAAGTGPPSP